MSSNEDVLKNESKTLQVTVVFLYNGTYIQQPEDDPSLQIVEIVILVVLLLVSFGANIFLLVTITSSYTLRRIPFNVLLTNLSAVFLIESLLNMIITLLYITAGAWQLGYTTCVWSSFYVQLVTIEVTFSISIMCAEGMLSVSQPFKFESYLTIKKQIVVIGTMWIVGISLCVPLLFKSVPSRLFVFRYGCASAGQGGFIHALFLTICVYCLMIIFGFGCLLNVAIRQFKEYRAHRRKSDVNYSDIFMQGDLWTEMANFKLIAWLALLYVLLELPYIVVHQTSALKTYPEENRENSTIPLPLIELTPRHDKAFTWFRYIYSCIFALLVFRSRKDIRHKFKALISCCNDNADREHSAPVKQSHKKTNKVTKKEVDYPLDITTPVLYISTEGLCLRQLDTTMGKLTNHNGFNSNHQPKFISYLCDVDNSISSEDFMNSLSTSFNPSLTLNSERRLSKESDMTLPDMSSGFSFNEKAESILAKDADATVLKPEAAVIPLPTKKSVRFADTLTIYRTLTPRKTPTPKWVVKKDDIRDRKMSRIPTRIRKVDKITPWKIELNTTYPVKTPSEESNLFGKHRNGSTLVKSNGLPNSKLGISKKTRKTIRKKKFSPPRWQINKLT